MSTVWSTADVTNPPDSAHNLNVSQSYPDWNKPRERYVLAPGETKTGLVVWDHYHDSIRVTRDVDEPISVRVLNHGPKIDRYYNSGDGAGFIAAGAVADIPVPPNGTNGVVIEFDFK